MIPPRPLALLLLCLLPLAGCYKSQYEGEKTRATDLEKKSQDTQKQLDQTKSDLASAQGRVQQLEGQLNGLRAGGTLVGFIDGKPASKDPIRWDGTQWVRHGECTRHGGTVKFENGRLADQTLFMSNPFGAQTGRPLYTGAVKFGKPDAEWIWFDDSGKPLMRETWSAGKLVEVAKASTAKGPLTWGKVGDKDREVWVRTAAAALRDLPELVRDTSAPPAPPAAAVAKPTTPPSAGAKKPAKPGK